MDAPFPAGLMDDIDEFFLTEGSRPPGEDFYWDVFRRPLLFPLQRRLELAAMMRLARTLEPRTVMEIGADKGGGLYHWCKCLPTVRSVIACEIRGCPYRRKFERAFPQIDFLWLEQSSRDVEAVVRVGNFLCGDRIDCLFIDGDKCSFVEDFDAYRSYMARKSLAFLHDIQDDEPRAAYERLCRRGYEHTEIVLLTESEEAMDRAENGARCSTAHEGWLRYWQGRSAGVGVVFVED